MEEVTFDTVCEILEQKGVNTEGFDTKELMVAAFLAGAAYCFDIMLKGAEDIKTVFKDGFKERYDVEEEDHE